MVIRAPVDEIVSGHVATSVHRRTFDTHTRALMRGNYTDHHKEPGILPFRA
jgi:hypothetical protein